MPIFPTKKEFSWSPKKTMDEAVGLGAAAGWGGIVLDLGTRGLIGGLGCSHVLRPPGRDCGAAGEDPSKGDHLSPERHSRKTLPLKSLISGNSVNCHPPIQKKTKIFVPTVIYLGLSRDKIYAILKAKRSLCRGTGNASDPPGHRAPESWIAGAATDHRPTSLTALCVDYRGGRAGSCSLAEFG